MRARTGPNLLTSPIDRDTCVPRFSCRMKILWPPTKVPLDRRGGAQRQGGALQTHNLPSRLAALPLPRRDSSRSSNPRTAPAGVNCLYCSDSKSAAEIDWFGLFWEPPKMLGALVRRCQSDAA